MASILKSLGEHFTDYVAIEISGNDMIVLAVPNGKVGEMSDQFFSMPNMSANRLNRQWHKRLGTQLVARRFDGVRLDHTLAGLTLRVDRFK